MKQVTEYKAIGFNALVDNSLTEFNEIINLLIKDGWQPLGPINMTPQASVTNNNPHFHAKDPQWVQTMVRYV